MQSVSWSRVSGDHYHGSCVEDEGCVVGVIICRRVRVYSVCHSVVISSQGSSLLANMLVFVSSFEIVLRHSYPSVIFNKREMGKEKKEDTRERKTPSVVIVIITRGSCYAMLHCRVVVSCHILSVSSFIWSSSPCLCATALLKALTTSSGTVSQSKLLV